ncbi:MAG: oxidoreductase/oxygenase, vanB family [Massilia sp.]|jgi:vanillate O-demethylase ferredoxin subunit|nr:oxidoreductase/oxygenase, vanB family [Massilia sp.]
MELKTIEVQVKRAAHEASDIKLFELGYADGSRLPPFEPGSHIDVHVADGILRQYSLCNGPDDTCSYLIAVKKEAASRGGSLGMHERIKVGDTLTISVPRNNFALSPHAARHLLIGAGIGITPLLSMGRHLMATGSQFELHYFSRSVGHAAFHALLSSPEFAGKVVFHLGLDPDGVRAALQTLLAQRTPDAHLYLCGPGPFMDQVRAQAAAAWPDDAVHLEYFAADQSLLAAPTEGFEVTLARSGRTYAVPESESIVEVLARHGIEVPVSCEQGVCGTCITNVLEGVPDHRDMFLSESEKKSCKQMALCVSRALTPKLVLDL